MTDEYNIIYLPLDIFRHLSLFCYLRTFINLTMCSKKLRQLYHENTVWASFISRDFHTYQYHPNYDVERYKQCMRRKILITLKIQRN